MRNTVFSLWLSLLALVLVSCAGRAVSSGRGRTVSVAQSGAADVVGNDSAALQKAAGLRLRETARASQQHLSGAVRDGCGECDARWNHGGREQGRERLYRRLPRRRDLSLPRAKRGGTELYRAQLQWRRNLLPDHRECDRRPLRVVRAFGLWNPPRNRQR